MVVATRHADSSMTVQTGGLLSAVRREQHVGGMANVVTRVVPVMSKNGSVVNVAGRSGSAGTPGGAHGRRASNGVNVHLVSGLSASDVALRSVPMPVRGAPA